jgi:Transmembrane domain of unknown function (DUF3566)
MPLPCSAERAHDDAELNRRIKRIAPLQAGKMLGVLYGGMGLIFFPFFVFAGLLSVFVQQSPQHGQAETAAPAVIAGLMVAMAVLMPVIYGAMGFVLGLLGAAIYNLVARWIGGIEVEVE